MREQERTIFIGWQEETGEEIADGIKAIAIIARKCNVEIVKLIATPEDLEITIRGTISNLRTFYDQEIDNSFEFIPWVEAETIPLRPSTSKPTHDYHSLQKQPATKPIATKPLPSPTRSQK